MLTWNRIQQTLNQDAMCDGSLLEKGAITESQRHTDIVTTQEYTIHGIATTTASLKYLWFIT